MQLSAITPARLPAQSDPIWLAAEIELGQHSALPKQSCKTLCPSIADLILADVGESALVIVLALR